MKAWILLLFLIPLYLFPQKTEVSGIVLNEQKNPVSSVHVFVANRAITTTDRQGKFKLFLKPGKYRLKFTHVSYKTTEKNIEVGANPQQIRIVLSSKTEKIPEIVIVSQNEKEKRGAVKIEKKILQTIPVLSSGIKDILVSLPSVTQLDEMSSQYLVRGGNYDENAVYINEIEVYRPFLSRTGKQEGLHIINSNLIENIHFYAGGFSAHLGDKLSSVLEIQYVKPRENTYHLEAGLTGGNLSVFKSSEKLSAVIGARYLNNTLLVEKTLGQAEYRPSFADLQSLVTYQFSPGVKTEWLNYFSWNKYRFVPFSKQTNFGTFTDSRALVIQYMGQEKDRFYSQFSALKTTFKPKKNKELIWINSFFHTTESEKFDILASYFIGEPNTDLSDNDFGNAENLTALGQQLDHARNLLDAVLLKTSLQIKTKHSVQLSSRLGFSVKYQNIRDRMNEYQIIDSAGFSLLPPYSDFNPQEPYISDTLPLLAFNLIKSDYLTEIITATTYFSMQIKYKNHWIEGEILPGLRANYWHFKEIFTGQTRQDYSISPRFLINGRLKSDKRHLFRLTAGLYMQPPSYREYRNLFGVINPNVLPQKAWNFSMAHQFDFDWKNLPFKITSEIYYRYLFDINPYRIENIRIRYLARNNATAFAYGMEVRLYGELLPQTPSWIGLSYSKTLENIEGRGYIPRPTDQRFKISLMFQDYVPKLPFLKMYLNNVFATGMPTGAPFYADPYQFQFRTRNYWRTDIGLYYVLTENDRFKKKIRRFKFASAGLEIINIFDRRNSISNLWVREIYSKRMMGIPNYMTGRIFNLKFKISW